jgi:hypothetical protein
MENTQPIQNTQSPQIQNSQYSQYVRGVATGAVAAGTLAAGAFAIHSYVHSGTKISALKEISISLAGGFSGLIMAGAVSSIPASYIPDHIKTGPHSVTGAAIVIKAISALSGGAASCVTLTAARLIERLL